MEQVKIYTTPTCAFCKMAKAYFKEHDVKYEEYNVAEDKEKLKEMFDKSGQMGVPVIDIKGKIILGFDQPGIEAALK